MDISMTYAYRPAVIITENKRFKIQFLLIFAQLKQKKYYLALYTIFVFWYPCYYAA